MNKSDSIANLAAALCLAQAKYPNIPRTKDVIVKTDKGSYKFFYAPFDHIVTAVRPILAEQSLAFVQCVIGDALVTTLMHVSGEFISDSMPMRPGTTAQAYGSELTYKRRYGLASVLGLATEDDDDGTRADPPEKPKKSTKIVADAYAKLPPEVQVNLTHEGKKIEADFYTVNVEAAYKRYKDLINDMTEDEHLGLWNVIDSKVRSGIKKYGEATREGT